MNYYKPTPKKWRKIGDSCLAISSFITGYGILGNQTWLALSGLFFGVIGKFLTNFFAE